eukprot:7385366-Prymnesium_polylepis.1
MAVLVNATVWRPSNPGFEWLELARESPVASYLAAREDFGIAFAGGGARGAAAALGAVRA